MDVLERLDEVVDEYVKANRFYAAYPTPEMAKMWIKQHRLNTRIRNSVMKLAVATNCPHWDIRMKIIGASAEELIADHEHGEGKAHRQIIEEPGPATPACVACNMPRRSVYATIDSRFSRSIRSQM
jgi:hypothetical protein